MAGNIRVKNYLDRDFEVLDRQKSLSLFIEYLLKDSTGNPRYTADIDGVSISGLESFTGVKDTSTKNPFDAYAAYIPNQFVRVGTLNFTATASAIGFATSDSCAITIFPVEDSVVNVHDQGTLNSSVTTAFADGKDHVRLILDAGTYTFPTDDLRAVDTLFTIEAAPGAQVYITDAIINLKWCKFKNIRFTTSNRAAAKLQGPGSTGCFLDCSFTGDGAYNVGRIGLETDASSRVKAVNCHFESLWEGTERVDSVRSCSWVNIGRSVFVDAARIVEGTVGYRNAYDIEKPNNGAWIQYTIPASPVIKDNIVVESYNTAIRSNSSIYNSVIRGNSIHTFTKKGLEVDTFESNYLVHNSIQTDLASICNNQTRYVDNYVINNYFSTVCSNPSQIVIGSTWVRNASPSTTNVTADKLLKIPDARFANNILLLRNNSPLLFKAQSGEGASAFGLIPYQNQIGSIPYHPDVELTSVLASFIKNPRFGFSLADSSLPNQFS